MTYSRENIGILALVVLVGAYFLYNNKTTERYNDVFSIQPSPRMMYGANSFSANLQPQPGQDPTMASYLSLRSSDPYASAGMMKSGFDPVNSSAYLAVGGTSTSLTLNGDKYSTSAGGSSDYASLVESKSMAPLPKKDSGMLKANNPMEYTTPQDLLPTPDMRQRLTKDPSDASNFMYDRTLFAPLKPRNLNTADRIRGDLDIQPIKTGWFDIATNPKVDLIKGYLGSFKDIEEYTDLQDIVYEKSASGDKFASAMADPRYQPPPKFMTKNESAQQPWGMGNTL
jgi:hypothetical protein